MESPVAFDEHDGAPTRTLDRRGHAGVTTDGGGRLGESNLGRTAFLAAARPIGHALSSLIASRRGRPACASLIELFIGAGWLRSAVEKTIDPEWWNGTVLREFVADHASLTLPLYRGFLDAIVAPNLQLISIIVVVGQVFAGAALLTGRKSVAGLLVGIFLNLNFVAAGAVNPSIFYLVCQAALLLWVMQFRAPQRVAVPALRWVAMVSLALFVCTVPFTTSLDPAAVIDDPALVLAFFGLVMAVSAWSGIPNTASASWSGSGRSRSSHETQL